MTSGNCAFSDLSTKSAIGHPVSNFNAEFKDVNKVAESNSESGPTLFELLVTFINLFQDFGTGKFGFSTKPNAPFGINSPIGPTFDALAKLGYLTKTDAGYIWTELSVPLMNAKEP